MQVPPTMNDGINNIIQLMHSFEVDIRICQPENSDAEVSITLER